MGLLEVLAALEEEVVDVTVDICVRAFLRACLYACVFVCFGHVCAPAFW